MATTTLTIPDATVDRVAAGLGWPEKAQSGETKGAFLKRRAIELIMNEVSQNEQIARVRAVPPDPALGIT